MRSFVTLALIALVAVNAVRITEEPAGGEKKEVQSEEEVKVGKFAFNKASEADRISQGRRVGDPYVKPLEEIVQEKAQADAIKDKLDHSDAVWKNAQDVTKAAKDAKDEKKEKKEDDAKEEKKAAM